MLVCRLTDGPWFTEIEVPMYFYSFLPVEPFVMDMELITQPERFRLRDLSRRIPVYRRPHPSVFTHMPLGWVAWVSFVIV